MRCGNELIEWSGSSVLLSHRRGSPLDSFRSLTFRFSSWLILLFAFAAEGCNRTETKDAPSAGASSGEPQVTVEQLLANAQRLLQASDYEGADRITKSILLRDGGNAEAMILAGQAAMGRQDVDSAVAMFDSAAELVPEQSASLMAQATQLLWQANRLTEAQQHFEDLLEKHPQFDDARRGLAKLLNQRGFRFDANQQIRVLCRRPGFQPTIDELRCLLVPSRSFIPFEEKPSVDDPTWISSKGELNVVRALFGEGDVRDALQVLKSSNVLKQRHPDAVALHGQILLEAQLFVEFKEWLSSAEKECRQYPAYWMALGGWAVREQQAETAVRLFAEAILREPGEIAAHDRMQQALELLQQKELALAFEQRAIQLRGIRKMIQLIFNNPNPSPVSVRQLAEQLGLVGRPFEAKSWRSLAGLMEGQTMQTAISADQELADLLASETATKTRNELLCGVDVTKYKVDLARLMEGTKRISSKSEMPDAVAATPVFRNVATEVGLNFQYVNADPPKQRYFLMHEAVGSGIACLDYDCDGLVDLYVGQGACNAPNTNGKLPNLMARNLGLMFQDVTQPSGTDDRSYTLGVTSGDWNQDGFPDLVVGNMTTNQLLINQGDGSFRSHPLTDDLWNDGKYTSSVAIADVTGDQIPDLVEVTYLDDEKIYEPLQLNANGIPVRFPGPLHFRACLDRVFVGRGDGDLTGQSLLTDSPSPGLGVLVTDIDGELGNEIFVANDMKANHLWRASGNEGSQISFADSAVAHGLAYGPSGTALACMGIAAADFDANGRLDIHITNFHDQWINLYLQNDQGLFDDLALPFGLDESSLSMLGFGTEALDFDNNTTIDLVTGNGHIDDLSHEGREFQMPTQFFVGDRNSLKQTVVEGDTNYWQSSHLTRGLVTLDWNEDGRMDFATTDLQEPLALLENQTQTENGWIKFRLVGRDCERDAIGARVLIELASGITFSHVVQTGDGYMSKNEAVIHCGLGNVHEVKSVMVTWPNGSREKHLNLAADVGWLLIQGHRPFQVTMSKR